MGRGNFRHIGKVCVFKIVISELRMETQAKYKVLQSWASVEIVAPVTAIVNKLARACFREGCLEHVIIEVPIEPKVGDQQAGSL